MKHLEDVRNIRQVKALRSRKVDELQSIVEGKPLKYPEKVWRGIWYTYQIATNLVSAMSSENAGGVRAPEMGRLTRKR